MLPRRPQIEWEGYIEGLGSVARMSGRFDTMIKEYPLLNLRLLSLRDRAYARIKQGNESTFAQRGGYGIEAILFAKNELPLGVRISPLIDPSLAEEAVRAHQDLNPFITDRKVYDQYRSRAEKELRKIPEKRNVLIFPSCYDFESSRMRNFDVARFFYQDTAFHQDFFPETNEILFQLFNPHYVEAQEGTIVSQAYAHGEARHFTVNCADLGLYYMNKTNLWGVQR
jgi:hypothetical protein